MNSFIFTRQIFARQTKYFKKKKQIIASYNDSLLTTDKKLYKEIYKHIFYRYINNYAELWGHYVLSGGTVTPSFSSTPQRNKREI